MPVAITIAGRRAGTAIVTTATIGITAITGMRSRSTISPITSIAIIVGTAAVTGGNQDNAV